MKNLLVAFALVGCIVACKSDNNKSVSDPAAPNTPKAECSAEKAGSCSGMEKAECSGEKSSCCTKEKPQG
jgi:hypothetical protein